MPHDKISVTKPEGLALPELGREALYTKALKIADILSSEPIVDSVYLYGSLASGNTRPNDIDLLVCSNDPDIVKSIFELRSLEAQGKVKDPYDAEEDIEELFFSKLSDQGSSDLLGTILNIDTKTKDVTTVPVDYFLVPSPLTTEYLELEARINKSPDFMSNIFAEALIFDPTKKIFYKKS